MTSRKWAAFLAVCFYIWMDISVNVTPDIQLVADIARDRQTTGAVLGQSWGIVGSVGVSAYIENWGPAHLSLHSFLGMLSSVMAVSPVVVCVAAQETPLEPAEVIASTTSTGARIRESLYAIVAGLRTLPPTLAVCGMIFFCVAHGFTAYVSNKGTFFGLFVFGGQAANTASCSPACSRAQNDYNRGVQLAGGVVDLACALVGCTFSLLLPLAVGSKCVLTTSLVPQACLIAMAFSKIVSLNVLIAVLTSFSQCVVFALVTPLVVHVIGAEQDIGVYVGALNLTSCFAQLLNFAVGAAMVLTSMGYQLPVLLGGAMGLLGLLVSAAFFQVKMH